MTLSPLSNSLRWTIETVAFVALLLGGTLVVRSWLAARDATTQLSATVAAQKQLLDQAAAREQQRDASLAKSLDAIAKARAAVKTPAQAAARIPSALPSLPAPISITIPEPKPGDPDPPAVATIPQQDLQPLYNDIEDCSVCQAKLTAAQADLSDERTKATALTAERDAAIKAAHRGGLWSRVKSNAKWLLIGGALGALATAAHPSHSTSHISP